MHPALHLYETATPELIEFLSNTVLGTHGAKYQHLDTKERIEQLENPLHLSLIRNKKILGNITFSRRGKNWYVRYFAFDSLYQRSNKKEKLQMSKSTLKTELRQFFKDKLDTGEVDEFYAYIDPKNDKSHFLATELGFIKSGELRTQTFSRLHPKLSSHYEKLNDTHLQQELIKTRFSKQKYFHIQNNPGEMHCLRDEHSEIIAFASTHSLKWKIQRLPGKFGSISVKLIPYIPFLNQIIRPHHHNFVGVDHVWIRGNDNKILEELFSSILANQNQKLIVWWTEEKQAKIFTKTNWGVMHALFNSSPVHLYSISNSLYFNDLSYFSVSSDFS